MKIFNLTFLSQKVLHNSFNKILVTLIILLTVLSGLSIIAGTLDHKTNSAINYPGQFSGVPKLLSHETAKVNILNTSFNLNEKNATSISYVPVINYLYVNNFFDGKISAINTTTDSIAANLSLGTGSDPYFMAYDPANTYLYVSDYGNGNISVINTTMNSIVKNITIGATGYSYLTYDPANNYMYAVNSNGARINVFAVNATTNSLVNTIQVDTDNSAYGIAYDPVNTYLYVITKTTTYGGNVTIINPATNSVVAGLNIGSKPSGIAYNPSNGYMYITDFGSSNVTIISSATNSVVKNVSVGSEPYGIVYDPASAEIYVSNSGSDTVSVINSTTNSVVANISVGTEPEGIVYDSSNTNLYVLNIEDFSVSEISTVDSYKVTFEESDLPSGSTWYVNITDQQPSPIKSGPITGNSYAINLINGTYSYTVVSINRGYAPLRTLNTFNVSGSDESVHTSFYTAYIVTFKESGLSSGTDWYVLVSGQPASGTISGDIFTINLPNGTYTYVTSSSNSNFEAYGNKTLTVNGSSVIEHISFVETYKVEFDTYEIPTGQVWYVNLTNGNSYKSKAPPMDTLPANVPKVTSTVSFSVPNGTYYYNIATVDKNYEPNGTFAVHIMVVEPVGFTSSLSSGSFTVNGAALYEGVNFSYAFKTTFTDSGLPSGTPWYVNLSNGQTLTSNTTTITSYEPNGTYSYTVATADKTYSPDKGSGTFTVNNSSVSETVTFSKVLFKVTFTESGLPSGTAWYVNGTGVSESSTSQNMVFELTNGTYTFTATNLSSYYTSASQFTVTIKGYNVSENVHYYHWAYITGTVLPDNATLAINGKDVAVSSNGSFNVSVANGTYDIVATDTGYHSFNTNVTLGNGAVKHISIDLKALHQKNPISQDVIYGAIAGVVAVAIVGVAVYTLRKR